MATRRVNSRLVSAALIIALLAVTLLIATRPQLTTDQAIARFGEPIAVAASYNIGPVKGGKALMHNRELRLCGLRVFSPAATSPGDILIYSDDSRVREYL